MLKLAEEVLLSEKWRGVMLGLMFAMFKKLELALRAVMS